MDDLIARTNKYARSAGRTGLGHYHAAEHNERIERWLGGMSAGLSAVVGTSIFAEWIQSWPLPFGIAAVVAAGMSAVQGTSKLSERAKSHRLAGAKYGRIRRKIDMLRLRIRAQDVSRLEAIAELDGIGDELSDLAQQSRALSDRVYYAAKNSFDQDHPEYQKSTPTHAGGVVIRGDRNSIQYLVVTAKDALDQWVLPKGHIEAGESPEQAARREVLEETGIVAAVRDDLDVVEFNAPAGLVRAQFFLMQTVTEGLPSEGRKTAWCSYDEANKLLSFPEARKLIHQAEIQLRHPV